MCVHVCVCDVWYVHARMCVFYVCLCFRCMCIVYVYKHVWYVYNVCICNDVWCVRVCMCDMCGVCMLAPDTWLIIFLGTRHKG